MIYLDTSAFVKYYGKEEYGKGFAEVKKIIESAKTGNEILISSYFIIGEAISVFDKWVRYKLITEEELSKAIKRFLADVKDLSDKGALILDPLTSSVITHCTELIVKRHISINDAIHLYTALGNKTQIGQFASSDEILLKAAKNEDFHVSNPEKVEENGAT